MVNAIYTLFWHFLVDAICTLFSSDIFVFRTWYHQKGYIGVELKRDFLNQFTVICYDINVLIKELNLDNVGEKSKLILQLPKHCFALAPSVTNFHHLLILVRKKSRN